VATPSWEKLNIKTEANKIPIERMYHTTIIINDNVFMIGGIKNGVVLSNLIKHLLI